MLWYYAQNLRLLCRSTGRPTKRATLPLGVSSRGVLVELEAKLANSCSWRGNCCPNFNQRYLQRQKPEERAPTHFPHCCILIISERDLYLFIGWTALFLFSQRVRGLRRSKTKGLVSKSSPCTLPNSILSESPALFSLYANCSKSIYVVLYKPLSLPLSSNRSPVNLQAKVSLSLSLSLPPSLSLPLSLNPPPDPPQPLLYNPLTSKCPRSKNLST